MTKGRLGVLAIVLIAGAAFCLGYWAIVDPNLTFAVRPCVEVRDTTTGRILPDVNQCLSEGARGLLDNQLVHVGCPTGFEWHGRQDVALCERVPTASG